MIFDGGVAGCGIRRARCPTPSPCARARRIVIERWPGKLVALLPVLAAALAVALPGDHGAARAFAPDVAGGEAQVDQRQAVLDAFGLVLEAARMQHDRAIGIREQCAAFSMASGGTPVISAACADPRRGPIPRLARSRWCARR